jgi:hypothetical protein
MDDQYRALVQAVHKSDPATVSFSELPALPPDNTFFHEWQTYRREVAKLIADGLEGKWVVIKGNAIQGVFEGWKLGYRFGLDRNKQQTFLLHQILTHEPIHRIDGILRWQISPSPLAKTA